MKKFLIKYIFLLLFLSVVSCEESTQVQSGPLMLFSVEDVQTKAYIDDLNRSGNQIVLFDYMKVPDYDDIETNDQYEWYIDHKRIYCEVDGQQVWDFVDGDEYYWLDGSVHNCFGWLYMGPSGFTTETFFGAHPDINHETGFLTLPAYDFNMTSPEYDFMYSDVCTRSFSNVNPDTSPIALEMNHLFSAFRFRVRNSRASYNIEITGATLNIRSKKTAQINFSKAKTGTGNVSVGYTTDNATTNGLRSNYSWTKKSDGKSIILNNTYENYNGLFSENGDDYHMMWPQSEDDIDKATLSITYVEHKHNEHNQNSHTVTLPLNKFSIPKWEAGKRYSYEIVFTDVEILLASAVTPWTRRTINLEFSDVVVVSDKIQWKESSVISVDDHKGEVVVKDSSNPEVQAEPAICYFKLAAPENARWHASLIGDSGAFEFVKLVDGQYQPYGNEEHPSGDVGQLAELMIRAKKTSFSDTDTKKAKLRIHLSLADGSTVVVENLCAGHDFNEYTLVRNLK